MAKNANSGAQMIASLGATIHDILADAVLRGSRTRGQSELIALAWTLRNRAERAIPGAESVVLDPAQAREFGQRLLADAGVENEPEALTNGKAQHHDEMAYQQALACVSLVFDGLVPDPTSGATRVHPHDQAPCWAEDFEATALIGPLMFLRERADAEDARKPDAN